MAWGGSVFARRSRNGYSLVRSVDYGGGGQKLSTFQMTPLSPNCTRKFMSSTAATAHDRIDERPTIIILCVNVRFCI